MEETPPTPPGEPVPETPVPAPSMAAPEIAAAALKVEAIRREIGKAMVGQTEVIEQALMALLAGGHVLLEGVPGLGKTLLVLALSRTFGGSSARIQFTPDLMPSDVTGHAVYEMATGTFRIRKGPAFTNLLLADEINRAPAKTQAALLEVMQEQQITIEGEAMPLDKPFMCLATQNPVEQEGTYPLPEAQLDRFLMNVHIGYPEEDEELALVRMFTVGHVGDGLHVDQVAQVVTAEEVTQMQAACSQVLVDDRVSAYLVELVRKTRSWQGVAVGAGPRGSMALMRVARAKALLSGRDYVTPDDIKDVMLPVLRHRMMLAPELEVEGHTSDDVLQAILQHVEAPRE